MLRYLMRPPGRLVSHFAELAHHYTAAGTLGDIAKAIDYGARAGRHAISQLSYEQAAAQFRAAAALIGEGPTTGCAGDAASSSSRKARPSSRPAITHRG